MSNLTTRPHGFDLENTFTWLQGKGRQAIRLHPRSAVVVGQHYSKVGGEIVWPSAEPWPHCEDHRSDYVPVLQLRACDLPHVEFPVGTDVLQILWCPNDHAEHGYGPHLGLFWWHTDSLVSVAANSRQVRIGNEDYMPQPCRVTPEVVMEYPSAFSLSLSEEQAEELSAWELEHGVSYQYFLSVAPGFKVGGYPHWVQSPQAVKCGCGREMDYLLTIDSAEFDGGTWERWLPEEERGVWEAEYSLRNRVQCAAGIMLGDMGNINVFICRRCSPWRYDWVFQCS